MTKASLLAAAAFACVAVAAHAAQAAERRDTQSPFGGAAITDDAMSRLRGGDPGPVQISDQNANSAGNTCVSCVSGGNNVDASSFAHATGIFTVIQNSGNNALLQNTTQVNVSIH